MTRLQNETGRALVVSSLWLHGGFIGAAALVVGLLQLFDGESRGLWAPWLALFGGALAAACWRRGWTILDSADRASIVGTDAATESASRPPPTQAPRSGIAAVAGSDAGEVVIR
jgi:hypothetical protein